MSIFLTLLVFLGCLLAGERILSLAGFKADRTPESVVLATATGLVLIALATTAFCVIGTISPITGWGFLGLMYAVNIPGLRSFLSYLPKVPAQIKHSIGTSARPSITVLMLISLIVLFGLYLVQALLPPAGQDSLVYHLAVPKAYLEHGGFTLLPNNKYSFFPLLFEMVYLFGMMLQVEPLPALLGWGTAVLLACGLAVYSHRRLMLAWPLLPAIPFFATPTFLEGTANAYIDIPTACFMLFAWISWDTWRSGREPCRFFLFCIFSSAAVTTKLTVLPVIALGVLGIAWVGRKQNISMVLKQVSIYLLTVLAFISPWWIRNFLYTGNPVAPFLMQFLGGDNVNWDADRAALHGTLLQQGTGRGLLDFVMAPWSVTFNAVKGGLPFDGDIGIIWLLASPALLLVPWRGQSTQAQIARPMALVLLVFWVFWFFYFQQIRFLAASFILLSPLLAIGIERMISNPHPASRIVPWVLAGGLLFNASSISNHWSQNKPWQGFTEERGAYLARVLPPYTVYQAMNEELAPTDKALFVYMRNYGYLTEKPFHSDSFFEAHTLLQILSANADPESLTAAFKQKGFTHLMFDNRFVFGKDSAFNHQQLTVLKDFLNKHAKLVHSENGFYLFRFVLD